MPGSLPPTFQGPAIAILWSALALPALAQIPLNDTGQTRCYAAAGDEADCATAGADGGAFPRQDARFGRDAAAAAGVLAKAGGGAAGFDFTALDTSGSPTAPGAHACVRDHVTGLIWSTETLAHTWADAAAASTHERCGFASGWRLPTRRELLSIVHNGASSPAIDGDHFPGTEDAAYWSGDAYGLDAARAWYVDFDDGAPGTGDKAASHAVRLVWKDANHAPAFTPGPDIVLDRLAQPGPISIPGWATNISAGPAHEAGQPLTATLRLLDVTDQQALEFDAEPVLDVATGTLSFTVRHTIYEPDSVWEGHTWVSSAGLARVAIELKDDGGTARGGADTTTGTFTIFLDPRPVGPPVMDNLFITNLYPNLPAVFAGTMNRDLFSISLS